MLSCRGLAHIASDYIDDELGTVNKLSVRMHLLMCPHCRTFMGNLRASAALLEKHSAQTLSADYLQRIDREIERALSNDNSRG
ncbi:MAG: zf-HC2 domain-containing protein [Oleiphilaceae bacterium]|nr:zf-HC2 domain-containing protein [Oleiphilaceae bacterium]